MAEAITVHCPSCQTAFPVDPAKVPSGGVDARCSECSDIFRVEDPADAAPGAVPDLDGDGSADTNAAAGVAPADEPGEPAETGAEPAETGTVDVEPAFGEVELADEESAEAEGPTEETGDSAAASDELELDTVNYFYGGGDDEETGGEDDDAMTTAGAGLEPEEAPPSEEDAPEAEEEEAADRALGSETAEAATSSRPTFGQRSPEEKAQRLARVLVSDMITYNPKLYEKAVAGGTLKEDFEDEIEKSWEEYVEQVGEELATSTPYWQEALNEILAKDDDVF